MCHIAYLGEPNPGRRFHAVFSCLTGLETSRKPVRNIH